MSRRVLGGHAAVVLAAVIALGGCSADDPGAKGGVTVEHVYGTTVVPDNPERIVTLGLSDQDPLLALGVQPIAVYPWYGDYEYATWPWAQDELGDAQPVVLNDGVRNEAKPPREEIASLKPDLIISLYNGTTKEQYEQLSDIAPVVVPDKEYANFAITWQEATRVTGEALGREDEAVALVEQLEQSFADAAEQNPSFAQQEVVVAERFEPGETIVRGGNDVRAKFFEQLGFTVPNEIAGVQADEYGELPVPDEQMLELSKDLLVWNVGFAPEARATVEGLGLYSQMPVVQAGNVLWVEDEVISGAFTWGTVLSLQYALDELLPQITEVAA
ncbi:ABC transporter substrate-binding protein [Epidermidibacterium keratini]|uniref:ABC transporter substrate-binding protein n=1 Tax=Epidermidibacterium keratini TaxID=1891644 RepID=A0A7L4YP07_9ACTN|nr:iron-siderophore ABC transporter substrate-binding protein [Epidermidibacterium keratini]QHC01005.1 ABC transporter substrate-binding protein [Epidermidibacterium keratini]